MKKNTLLDTKGFLLMETLLVSLTIAGILLYMYVQYSRITDSYHRLSNYNSVEKLYRAGNLKKLLIIGDEDSFYNEVDVGMYPPNSYKEKIKGVYKLENINFTTNNTKILDNLDVEGAYIVKGDADLTKVDATFGPFLKALPTVGKDDYQLIVKYKDGEFAAITIREE